MNDHPQQENAYCTVLLKVCQCPCTIRLKRLQLSLNERLMMQQMYDSVVDLSADWSPPVWIQNTCLKLSLENRARGWVEDIWVWVQPQNFRILFIHWAWAWWPWSTETTKGWGAGWSAERHCHLNNTHKQPSYRSINSIHIQSADRYVTKQIIEFERRLKHWFLFKSCCAAMQTMKIGDDWTICQPIPLEADVGFLISCLLGLWQFCHCKANDELF